MLLNSNERVRIYNLLNYSRIGGHMSVVQKDLQQLLNAGYEHGFVSNVVSDTIPPGLDEEVSSSFSRCRKSPGATASINPVSS